MQRTAPPEEIDTACRGFLRDGYLVLREVIDARELAALRAETAALIDEGWRDKREDIDYFFTAAGVFHRIQYVFPKAPSLLTLLAHPRLLALVRGLLGPDFICCGEAMVFKSPRDSVEVPLHRDFGPDEPLIAPEHGCFNIDVYLDDATSENGCLEVMPRTHLSSSSVAELAGHGFDTPGLVPVPVRAGDVIVHDLRTIHGSRRSRHPALRRTVYYEFHRRDRVERDGVRPGKMVPPGWAANRARIIDRAIALRRNTAWGADEQSDAYHLPPDVAPSGAVDLRPRLGWSKFA